MFSCAYYPLSFARLIHVAILSLPREIFDSLLTDSASGCFSLHFGAFVCIYINMSQISLHVKSLRIQTIRNKEARMVNAVQSLLHTLPLPFTILIPSTAHPDPCKISILTRCPNQSRGFIKESLF